MKVFAIYDLKDKPVVSPILSFIEENGIDIMRDEDVSLGEEVASKIVREIETADVIVYFHSQNAKVSQWTRREVAFASNRKKQIVVVALDGAKPSSALGSEYFYTLTLPISWDPDNDSCREILLSRILESGREGDNLKDPGKGCCWIKLVAILGAILIILYCIGMCTFCASPPSSENECVDSCTVVEPRDSLSAANDSILQSDEEPTSQPTYEPQTEQSDDGLSPLLVILIALPAIGLVLYLYYKGKYHSVKLSSKFPATIYIDGKEVAHIVAYATHVARLKSGTYMIDFVSDDASHTPYTVAVGRGKDNFVCAEKSTELMAAPKKNNTIKIFIAGSLDLQAERDALRSTISMMYNHWQSHDFHVLSYTFEDFSNSFKPGDSPQDEYDRFIQNEADWAVFIISGHVGEITLREFNKAISALMDKHRPEILVLSNREADNDQARHMQRIVNHYQQYWTSYSTITELKKEFESALNWHLIELLHNPQ